MSISFQMGLKVVWVFFVAIVVFGFWWIFHNGIRPRAVKIIKPSFFQTPEEFGALAYKVLRPRLAMREVTFVGGQPGLAAHDRVLEGFYLAAQEQDPKFSTLIVQGSQSKLREAPNLDVVDLQAGGPPLREVIAQAFEKKQRVLVYLSAHEAVHFISSSVVNEIEQFTKRKGLSLVLLQLAGPEGREPIEPCVRPDPDKYMHSIGCILEEKNRALALKHKIKWDKFVGILDQEGDTDFVLYTH